MACSSSCRTQDHASYGECLRSKNLKTAYMQDWKGADYTRQKKADKELDAYAKARKEGIQPKSTKRRDIEYAIKQSDKTGTAFQA
jgi:hypothetical protein